MHGLGPAAEGHDALVQSPATYKAARGHASQIPGRSAVAETGNVSQSPVTSTTQLDRPRGQSQSLSPGSQPQRPDSTMNAGAHRSDRDANPRRGSSRPSHGCRASTKSPSLGARDLYCPPYPRAGRAGVTNVLLSPTGWSVSRGRPCASGSRVRNHAEHDLGGRHHAYLLCLQR